MRADADHDRGGDQVALVPGEVEPEPVGVLAAQGVGHHPEVGQPARGEVVALGGVHVEVVEQLEVALLVTAPAAGAELDARLGRLLDVAAPELVHPGQHVVLGAAGQRDLEDGLRLPEREPPRRCPAAASPATVSWETTRAPTGSRSEGGRSPRRRTAGSAIPSLTWAALHRRVTTGGPIRTPKAPAALRCCGHRGQPVVEPVGGPVEHRALGQVGEVALDLGQLAVEHQARPDELGAVAYQPMDSCRHSDFTRPQAGVCRKLAERWRAGRRGGPPG